MRFSLLLCALTGSALAAPFDHSHDATAHQVIRRAPGDHVVHERRSVAPASRWHDLGPVPANRKLAVRIGLRQSNVHDAESHLMDVSNPDSPNHGAFWSEERVNEVFAPSDEAVDAVRGWLRSAGVNERATLHTQNRGWLVFSASASELDDLLQTKYHEYENARTGGRTVACSQYHVPTTVKEYIDYITPGIRLAAPPQNAAGKQAAKRADKSLARRSRSPSRLTGSGHYAPRRVPVHPPLIKEASNPVANCDKLITPECVATLYNIPPQSKHVDPSNSLGIFEDGDTYDQTDLDLFFANTSATYHIPNGTHPKPAFIDGATAPVPEQEGGGESLLDFQLAYPIIYPQTITLFQTDDAPNADGEYGKMGFFNTFLDALDGSYCKFCAYGECGDSPSLDPVYPDNSSEPGAYHGQLMCGVYKPTNVISVSYGEQEDDVPHPYQQRQCLEILKLGLRGVSVLFASGDDGVAGPPGDASDNGCLNNGKVFNPAFPNTCPWLTNVGATKLYPGHSPYERPQPEAAVYDPPGEPYAIAFASGGGFSNIYPTPEYQREAVHTYLTEHTPEYPSYGSSGGYGNGVYNHTGRGYPDVAANGDNIADWTGGIYSTSGGTSASTPIFASIINRLIEERLAKGHGPIGFLNPTLYKNPHALRDVVNGSNPGCGTKGFQTAPGWDPATGLGTPDFPKLRKVFVPGV